MVNVVKYTMHASYRYIKQPTHLELQYLPILWILSSQLVSVVNWPMVIVVSPLRMGLWDPFQMAVYMAEINGG